MVYTLDDELTQIPQRVAAGVLWLNEHHPDFRQRVSLKELNVANCHTCVMGQLVGDEYFDQHTPETYRHDIDHGFDSPHPYTRPGESIEYYQALTTAWKNVLQAA